MSQSPWRTNSSWIEANDPVLQRLIFDVPAPGPLRLDKGRVCWHRGLAPTVVDLSPAQIEASLAGVDPDRPVVLVGAGRGDLLLRLLERCRSTITVWDRNATFLRPALLLHDVSEALASGALRLAYGPDLLKLEGQRVVHPILGSAYADELAIEGRGRPRALLVDGTLFVDDLGEALRQRGWDVFRWDVHDLPEAELNRIALHVGPDRVFAINHTHGLAEACEALGVPLTVWEIDPSTDRIRPTRAIGAQVWTWRKSQVAAYQNAGFEARYLPLATNPGRRAPVALSAEEQAEYAVPVAYVGSSMVERGRSLLDLFVTTFGRVYGDAEAGARVARELLEVQAHQAHARGYVLPGLLHQVCPDLEARFAEAGCRHQAHALLGELAAARYRLEVLGAVAPMGLHVWGDTGWGLLARHGAQVRGWAGHYHELNRIYSGAKVHIDVARLYQTDIVPMRIFDVIACGGFVLAQHSEALDEVLKPGVEVVSWRTPAELREQVAYYLAHPEARERVVRAGRARILQDHTIAARLEQMLAQPRPQTRAA